MRSEELTKTPTPFVVKVFRDVEICANQQSATTSVNINPRNVMTKMTMANVSVLQ